MGGRALVLGYGSGHRFASICLGYTLDMPWVYIGYAVPFHKLIKYHNSLYDI